MARILVADDEAPIREMISMACAIEGHETAEAFDTASTIAAYTTEAPDLLILDLAMPGGGGIEVLRHLRAAQALVSPVIIVSGFVADIGGEGRKLVREAFRVVEKPFALDTLRAAIREALAAP